MTIKEIKEAMLSYTDFYGGDISDTAEIKRAKTRRDLADVLNRHESHLEDMLEDAKSHLRNFKDSVGLSIV